MSRESFLAGLGVFLIRLIFSTVRLEYRGAEMVLNPPFKPVILCFWHNRILGITLAFLRKYPAKRAGVTVLTSASRDGEILAGIMAGLNMGSVRGSSSRRGSQALRELIRLVETGRDIAITPDGPRGPRYKLNPGVISLAQTTGATILPVHAHFTRCIRMKTWDAFMIPLPFSKVLVTVDQPIQVPAELTDEEFETTRKNLETILKNEAD